MIRSTLRRQTTVTDPAEFDKRHAALMGRLLPVLQRQPGFVSHEMSRDGDGGAMVEVTSWETEDALRSYLREGGAAMAATILDAFFPTAAYPNGNWVRT
jgi:heme-degrading monooxygenase HmoA